MLNASWLKLDTLLETASVLILFLRIRRIDSLEISILSGIPARAKAANEASYFTTIYNAEINWKVKIILLGIRVSMPFDTTPTSPLHLVIRSPVWYLFRDSHFEAIIRSNTSALI